MDPDLDRIAVQSVICQEDQISFPPNGDDGVSNIEHQNLATRDDPDSISHQDFAANDKVKPVIDSGGDEQGQHHYGVNRVDVDQNYFEIGSQEQDKHMFGSEASVFDNRPDKDQHEYGIGTVSLDQPNHEIVSNAHDQHGDRSGTSDENQSAQAYDQRRDRSRTSDENQSTQADDQRGDRSGTSDENQSTQADDQDGDRSGTGDENQSTQADDQRGDRNGTGVENQSNYENTQVDEQYNQSGPSDTQNSVYNQHDEDDNCYKAEHAPQAVGDETKQQEDADVNLHTPLSSERGISAPFSKTATCTVDSFAMQTDQEAQKLASDVITGPLPSSFSRDDVSGTELNVGESSAMPVQEMAEFSPISPPEVLETLVYAVESQSVASPETSPPANAESEPGTKIEDEEQTSVAPTPQSPVVNDFNKSLSENESEELVKTKDTEPDLPKPSESQEVSHDSCEVTHAEQEVTPPVGVLSDKAGDYLMKIIQRWCQQSFNFTDSVQISGTLKFCVDGVTSTELNVEEMVKPSGSVFDNQNNRLPMDTDVMELSDLSGSRLGKAAGLNVPTQVGEDLVKEFMASCSFDPGKSKSRMEQGAQTDAVSPGKPSPPKKRGRKPKKKKVPTATLR